MMSHAEKCLVCEGLGRSYGGHSESTDAAPICLGCNGKGWVEIGRDRSTETLRDKIVDVEQSIKKQESVAALQEQSIDCLDSLLDDARDRIVELEGRMGSIAGDEE